jgi:hypothetical protein
MEDLVSQRSALQQLCHSRGCLYAPGHYSVDKSQVDFPCYHIYSGGVFKKDSKLPQVTISFQFIRRFSRIRPVFEAITEDGRDVFAKFGNGHYGAEAHQAAAVLPQLFRDIKSSMAECGWWMAIMEPLTAGFTASDEFKSIPEACAQIIRNMKFFHLLGFAHGDLRDTNVFVRHLVVCLLISTGLGSRQKLRTHTAPQMFGGLNITWVGSMMI